MDLKTALAALLMVSLLLPTLAYAETECTPAIPGDCTITITINIAFSYNQNEVSPQQVQGWVDEIEDVWNGPTGSQTYGDCGCEVKFEVNHIKITDPAQINCNPPPEGYHCIMVTDYSTKPPKDTKGNTYRAYMYGVSKNGDSEKGWWSDIVGDPHPDSPTGENAVDAAHEAGHMMGLDDDYDKGPPERHGENIMGTTHGPNAKPTQDQINQVVENICGDDACPDECCCGNGVIEEDKGETCDPFLDPTGCEEGTYCCELCCNCHEQLCAPEMGSYATEKDCKSVCTDGQCLFNYDTGCWDCVEYETVITPSPPPETPAPAGEGGIDIGGLLPLGLLFLGILLALIGAAMRNMLLLLLGILLLVIGALLIWVFPPLPPAVPGGVPPAVPGAPAGQPQAPQPPEAEDPPEDITDVEDTSGCDEEDLAYPTKAGCDAECDGENERCYKNYQTGCWDCVFLDPVLTFPTGKTDCGLDVSCPPAREGCELIGWTYTKNYAVESYWGAVDPGPGGYVFIRSKTTPDCDEIIACTYACVEQDCSMADDCKEGEDCQLWCCPDEEEEGYKMGFSCTEGEDPKCVPMDPEDIKVYIEDNNLPPGFGSCGPEGLAHTPPCFDDEDCGDTLDYICHLGVCVKEEEEPEPVCGDGYCSPGEMCDVCGRDCRCDLPGWLCDPSDPDADSHGCVEEGGTICGDGVCSPGENCHTCADDCGCTGSKICGITDANPNPHCMNPPICEEPCYLLSGAACSCDAGHCSCPSGTVCCDPDDEECDGDKFGCAPEEEYVCGDDFCDPDHEDCESCDDDCGCGSGWVCDPDDSHADDRGCVEEEPAAVCGDGRCDPDEDCDLCDDDCGCGGDEMCLPDHDDAGDDGCVTLRCGDGMCMPERGETCECVDCEDACPIGLYCNPEDPGADMLGCSPNPPGGAVCGNGLCEETEYCYTCWEDCKCTVPGTCCHPSHGGIGCGTEFCAPVDV